jgi:penicillin-binding protein 1C
MNLIRPLLLVPAALALVLAAGVGATLAWSRYEASLGPLYLAASREGSTVVVDRDGRLLRLALKALGDVPPFAWFVNGQPIREAGVRREGAWKPDGAGFARVSVIDGKGTSDAVTVRLE